MEAPSLGLFPSSFWKGNLLDVEVLHLVEVHWSLEHFSEVAKIPHSHTLHGDSPLQAVQIWLLKVFEVSQVYPTLENNFPYVWW